MKEIRKVIIRQFKEEDSEEVSKVIQKTMLETNIEDYPMSILKPLHDYFTPSKVKVLASERYCLVAIIDDEIVGTGAYEEGELKTIFVNPPYQGQGIGKQLIKALEEQAKKLGLQIMTVPASISGAAFYEKLGYKKIKTFFK